MYVVKSKETGAFLTSAGKWSSRITEAVQFPNGRSIFLHLKMQPAIKSEADYEVLSLASFAG
jgi:hypothetical protein